MQHLTLEQIQQHIAQSAFMRVAWEYVHAPNQPDWQHVPHIITVRSPEEEAFILETRRSLNAQFGACVEFGYLLYKEHRNLLLEMRERVKDIPDYLINAHPGAVVPDTVMHFGRTRYKYRMGVAIRPNDIAALDQKVFSGCTFRPMTEGALKRIVKSGRLGLFR